MEPEWLSYAEVANRLGIAPEAARSRAKRLGWRRQMGNDGRALVLVALEPRPAGDRPETARRPPGRKAVEAGLIKALEGELDGLREALIEARARADAAVARLAEEKARAEKQADDLVAYDTAYAAGLAAERAKVEAERAKAERLIAEFAARDAQQAADLAAEKARTDRAIAAFADLADRLDALAERSRPWWRRLVG